MNQDEQDSKMQDEQNKKMSQLIAKCWSDDSFKRKFMSDPAGTLKAEGIEMELPTGMSVKAVENSDTVFHLVIPAKPTDLSDEELDMVAGGLVHCRGCRGSIGFYCRGCVTYQCY